MVKNVKKKRPVPPKGTVSIIETRDEVTCSGYPCEATVIRMPSPTGKMMSLLLVTASMPGDRRIEVRREWHIKTTSALRALREFESS